MVYRCFVIGRIYFKYDFIYGKLFSIIKFDFFCENFDVFLIDIQLFLFFRLIELCLVLYYGILEFLSFENELVISVKSIDDSVDIIVEGRSYYYYWMYLVYYSFDYLCICYCFLLLCEFCIL